MRPRLALLALATALCLVGCKGKPPAAAPAPEPSPAAPSAPEPDVATAAPAPASAVPELPDYPGATRLKLETGEAKEGFARTVEAKFTTPDPLATVREFYEKTIEANGWQVDASSVRTEKGSGKVKWTLSKGTSAGKVELESEKEGVVEIKLERKDR